MAELFNYTIQNLIQGISQQPDAQRDPSQGEIQINGVSSLTDGLRKRDGTRSIARLSTSPLGDVMFHQIRRDADEQYLVAIAKTAIRVFGLDGTEYTVNAPYGYGYLSTVVNARNDIRAASIADFTFISNTRRVPAMKTDLAPAVPRPAANEALVWVRAANYGQTYNLNVNGKLATLTTAVAPVVVTGSTTTENRISATAIASQLRGALLGGAATALTLVSSATTLNGTVSNAATSTNEGGSGLTVSVTGNGTVITAVAIGNAAGTAYQSGDKVYVARGLLQGGADTTPVQVATIATAVAGPLSGVQIARSGSVLHLTSASPITISATDARANADITAILTSVQAFTELPTIAPRGYQIEIIGDPGNKFDGYYVSFEPRSGDFGEGSWIETVSPGCEYIINEDTMPHLLVRLGDGTFYFGPANFSTQGGTVIPAWGNRVAGDYETAPDPSFIGYPVQDLFVYKNRLGMLADENVILSRTRDFFQFFPETVTTVLDTDPIDLTATNSRVAVLRYAVPYQDELIIFSDQIQFRFNAAETVLTPATAQITVLTQYDIDPNCRPVQAQGSIVFCQENGQWARFREMSVRGAGTALVADAFDLTVYVSNYIPSEIIRIAGNDTDNVWYALSDKDGYRDRLYTHKYFFRNTGSGAERAQSSWSYWQLSGADAILSILCIRETLYLLTQYGNEVWLEAVSAADRADSHSPAPYQPLLDRRITTGQETPAALRVAAGTYNAIANTTTWTLPFAMAAHTQAWSLFAPGKDGGVLLAEASSGNTLTAWGDWSTTPVVFGEVFPFRYRFTRFKLYQDGNGGRTASSMMRTHVRYAKLRYHRSRYFEVWVLPERRDPSVYKFPGTILGSRLSQLGADIADDIDVEDPRYLEGVFHIPIQAKGDQTIVEIRNDTAAPCQFSSLDWVALITGKGRNIG